MSKTTKTPKPLAPCGACDQWNRGGPCEYNRFVTLEIRKETRARREKARPSDESPQDQKAKPEEICIHCMKASQCLRAYSILFAVAGGMSKRDLAAVLEWSAFVRFRELSISRQLLPYLKWKNNAIMAWAFDQPPPARPTCVAPEESFDIFGGSAYQLIRTMKKRLSVGDTDGDRRRALIFFLAFLNAKRGLPRPDEQDLIQAVLETQEKLTKGVDYGAIQPFVFKEWETNPPIMRDWQVLVSWVRRTVIAVMANCDKFDNEPELCFPSSNAHLETKKTDGGAAAFWLNEEDCGTEQCWTKDENYGNVMNCYLRAKWPKLMNRAGGFLSKRHFADNCLERAKAYAQQVGTWNKVGKNDLLLTILNWQTNCRDEYMDLKNLHERSMAADLEFKTLCSDRLLSNAVYWTRGGKRGQWLESEVYVVEDGRVTNDSVGEECYSLCSWVSKPEGGGNYEPAGAWKTCPAIYDSYGVKFRLEKYLKWDDCHQDDWVEDDILNVLSDPMLSAKRIVHQKLKVESSLRASWLARPHALAEALKVRVITIGQAKAYTALTPLQKWMWRQVKRDPRFAIGGPITALDVGKRLGKLDTHEKWCSGDYKAATDNINPYLSCVVADTMALCGGLQPHYRELLLRGLCGHNIIQQEINAKGKLDIMKDGDRNDPNLEPLSIPQSAGQLMGSPVSFPVLCLINFAVIWYAKSKARGADIPFRELKVLINGDDCLFAATEEEYSEWMKIAKMAGLTPSVGKTYWSESIQVVNSTLFDYASHTMVGAYPISPQIPDLNLGLVFGVHRDGSVAGMNAESTEFSEDAGARCVRLLDQTTAKEAIPWLELFKEHNAKKRDSATNIPWHLPRSLGGLGLPSIVRERTSAAQFIWQCETVLKTTQPMGDNGVDVVLESFKLNLTLVEQRDFEFIIGPSDQDLQSAAYLIDRDRAGHPVQTPPAGKPKAELTVYTEACRQLRNSLGEIIVPAKDDVTGDPSHYSWWAWGDSLELADKRNQKTNALMGFWKKVHSRPESYGRKATAEELLTFSPLYRSCAPFRILS